jgi:hypothetical protein
VAREPRHPFLGRCHEYPTIGGHPTLALVDSVIRHDATPGTGEGANARNLRILTEEFAEDPSPRVAFYLGSTHKDAGRWREAVAAYATRIAMGEAYRDEWLFAYLYKGRCERVAGDVDAAERTLLEAVSRERSWAEFWMELAYIAYDQRAGTNRSATRCRPRRCRCRRRCCGASSTSTATSRHAWRRCATSKWGKGPPRSIGRSARGAR